MITYAIKIRKSDLDLITVLNGGVRPEIEKKTTYFVFDLDGPTVVNADIMSYREFLNYRLISNNSPLLLRLNK